MTSGSPPQGKTQGPSILLAEVAVVGMALIWGVNYSVIKYGTSLMNPLAYNGLRVALSAIAMLTIASIWGGSPPSRRDLLLIIVLGALGNGIYQIFFAEGIYRTRAGEAALVVGASPALMALFGRIGGVERVTRWSIIGITVSICGVGLIVLGRATAGSGPPGSEGGSLFGDLLVLVGAICWAIYTILLIPITKRQNGMWVVGWSLVGGSIVLGVAGGRQIAALSWPDVPLGAWLAMLYGSLGGLVIAYLLWYRGVKVLGPTRTALFGNLQPLIALFVAWITLHETPTVWQSVGAAAIVGGVLLTRAVAPVES